MNKLGHHTVKDREDMSLSNMSSLDKLKPRRLMRSCIRKWRKNKLTKRFMTRTSYKYKKYKLLYIIPFFMVWVCVCMRVQIYMVAGCKKNLKYYKWTFISSHQAHNLNVKFLIHTFHRMTHTFTQFPSRKDHKKEIRSVIFQRSTKAFII